MKGIFSIYLIIIFFQHAYSQEDKNIVDNDEMKLIEILNDTDSEFKIHSQRIFFLKNLNGTDGSKSSRIRVQISFTDEMTRNQLSYVMKRALETLKDKFSPEKLIWLQKSDNNDDENNDTEISVEYVAVIIAEIIGTFIALAWGVFSQFLDIINGNTSKVDI